jgi:H+/Cl- antiporter ClcA
MMIKVFATGITLGAGGNGVTCASLFVGSYLGYVFSKLINLTGLTQLPVSILLWWVWLVFWIISCLPAIFLLLK